MTLIFHILSRDAALLAREKGEYQAESLAREGFIHFSGLHQLLGVANRFYIGQHGLVILAVDTSRLKAELKYEGPVHPAALNSVDVQNEDSSHDKHLSYNNDQVDAQPSANDLFPHLYGPLNFDAVIAMHDLEPNVNGTFSLPAALASDTDIMPAG